MTDSDTASFPYTIQDKVATPTANPSPGTYNSAQNIALSCATVGATIRYTTNGTEPTSSSTVYSSPIAVSATTTIKAKAFKAGMTDSDTASFPYTIQDKVATPTANPSPGTYNSAQNIALSCATSSATIRYTTNGTEPTSSSTVYSSPIAVSTTTTIKAKAFKAGMTDSDTASFTYTISPSGGSSYSLEFYEYSWGVYYPCDFFYWVDYYNGSSITIYAKVLDSQGNFVTAPQLVSIEYISDSGVQNTTGEFTVEDLELDPWDNMGETYVTATATLSDGTILQEVALVEAIIIAPK